MAGWTQFYAVVASVAATLMGLLFVAVSVNARQSIGPGHDMSRRLSEQALQNYLTTVLVSLLALMPGETDRLFGIVTLLISGLGAAIGVVRFFALMFKTTHQEENRMSAVRRYLFSLIGFGMLIYAAVTLALGLEDEKYLFASAMLVLIGSATWGAWELLLRIAHVEVDPKI